MSKSPSSLRSRTRPVRNAHTQTAARLAELESIAQLVEDQIPNFKTEAERQFYREVAQGYRTAARALLPDRNAKDKTSHD